MTPLHVLAAELAQTIANMELQALGDHISLVQLEAVCFKALLQAVQEP